MPRIGPRLRKSVFFLYGANPKSGDQAPIGTGVFMGVEPSHLDQQANLCRHIYALTCAHVARNGGLHLRVNRKGGGSRLIEIEDRDWRFSKATDLAAADITEALEDEDDMAVVPRSWLAPSGYLDLYGVDIGEDVFMLGMFSEEPGVGENRVSARFGNISLLADDDHGVEHSDGVRRPAHVLDMNSRAGYSGSPVFLFRTPAGDLRRIDRGPPRAWSGPQPFRSAAEGHARDAEAYWRERENTLLSLLGVHVGGYRDKVEARKASRLRNEADDAIRDRDHLLIPNSLALAAPADAIVDLLDHPGFEAQRAARDEGASQDFPDVMLERSVYSGWERH